MVNRTYIQEQINYFDEYRENETKEERITRLQGILDSNKYYFDVNNDTSKNSSSEVADSPVDASRGATLQDKRVVNMKTVGLSGKFSSRCTNNSSFPASDNRIGIIIRYFEDALAKQKIYTVCRKGSMFYNMMLNSVKISFGEYMSTINVSLSFTEVNIITNDIKDDVSGAYSSSMLYTISEGYNKTLFSNLQAVKNPYGGEWYLEKKIELNPPKVYYYLDGYDIYIAVENFNIYTPYDPENPPKYKTFYYIKFPVVGTVKYTYTRTDGSYTWRNTYRLGGNENITISDNVACFKCGSITELKQSSVKYDITDVVIEVKIGGKTLGGKDYRSDITFVSESLKELNGGLWAGKRNWSAVQVVFEDSPTVTIPLDDSKFK